MSWFTTNTKQQEQEAKFAALLLAIKLIEQEDDFFGDNSEHKKGSDSFAWALLIYMGVMFTNVEKVAATPSAAKPMFIIAMFIELGVLFFKTLHYLTARNKAFFNSLDWGVTAAAVLGVVAAVLTPLFGGIAYGAIGPYIFFGVLLSRAIYHTALGIYSWVKLKQVEKLEIKEKLELFEKLKTKADQELLKNSAELEKQINYYTLKIANSSGLLKSYYEWRLSKLERQAKLETLARIEDAERIKDPNYISPVDRSVQKNFLRSQRNTHFVYAAICLTAASVVGVVLAMAPYLAPLITGVKHALLVMLIQIGGASIVAGAGVSFFTIAWWKNKQLKKLEATKPARIAVQNPTFSNTADLQKKLGNSPKLPEIFNENENAEKTAEQVAPASKKEVVKEPWRNNRMATVFSNAKHGIFHTDLILQLRALPAEQRQGTLLNLLQDKITSLQAQNAAKPNSGENSKRLAKIDALTMLSDLVNETVTKDLNTRKAENVDSGKIIYNFKDLMAYIDSDPKLKSKVFQAFKAGATGIGEVESLFRVTEYYLKTRKPEFTKPETYQLTYSAFAASAA